MQGARAHPGLIQVHILPLLTQLTSPSSGTLQTLLAGASKDQAGERTKLMMASGRGASCAMQNAYT